MHVSTDLNFICCCSCFPRMGVIPVCSDLGPLQSASMIHTPTEPTPYLSSRAPCQDFIRFAQMRPLFVQNPSLTLVSVVTLAYPKTPFLKNSFLPPTVLSNGPAPPSPSPPPLHRAERWRSVLGEVLFYLQVRRSKRGRANATEKLLWHECGSENAVASCSVSAAANL